MCDTCKLDLSQSLTPTPVLGMLNRLGVFSYFDTAASYLDSKLYRPRLSAVAQVRIALHEL